MKRLNSKKGISLIVLVITIIVMIILATAIILSLNSSNIVEKAKEAKTASDLANAKNVAILAKGEWELMTTAEQNANGGSYSAYAENKLKEAGYALSGNGGVTVSSNGVVSTIYVGDDNRVAIIPEGFTVSTKASEDSVTEGLVIIDNKGNEFVWIPVEDAFERVNWNNETDFAITYPEPSSYDISEANDLTGEYAEYAKMKTSVQENKGFYIGRYEAGTTIARTNIVNGTTDVLVQKGKPVYNFVGWGPSMTSVNGDVTYSSKNQGKGAVELSRNMYKGSSSVASTLCYGVQWDSALQFIATNPNHADYPLDSTDKGNYTGTIANTGSNDDYAVNNIYDMAGNVEEWTMETEFTGGRILRGCLDYGQPAPASGRNPQTSTIALDTYGFRLALYLK